MIRMMSSEAQHGSAFEKKQKPCLTSSAWCRSTSAEKGAGGGEGSQAGVQQLSAH